MTLRLDVMPTAHNQRGKRYARLVTVAVSPMFGLRPCRRVSLGTETRESDSSASYSSGSCHLLVVKLPLGVLHIAAMRLSVRSLMQLLEGCEGRRTASDGWRPE